MKEILRKHTLTLIGVVLGALGGFMYWRFIGCSSGTCPITSSPFMSPIWGAAMGGLLLSMLKKNSAK